MNCSVEASLGMRSGALRELCKPCLFFVGIFLIPYSNYLTSLPGTSYQPPLKRPIFSSDAAVQTDAVSLNIDSSPYNFDGKADNSDDQESTLSAADLASILKWSKEISSDINLSSGLRNLCAVLPQSETF